MSAALDARPARAAAPPLHRLRVPGLQPAGPHLALENVELPLIYRGRRRAERRALALRGAGAASASKGREHHDPARALRRPAAARRHRARHRHRPAVLLADEPTGNLDTARSREIMELLTGLNRDEGITIVMVTHEPDMAALCRPPGASSSTAASTAMHRSRRPPDVAVRRDQARAAGDPAQCAALVPDRARHRHRRRAP